jgi:hypothetical protein
MAQKLVTTLTLLLFLLAVILVLSINDGHHVRLDDMIYLPVISGFVGKLPVNTGYRIK